ncbi:MAG: LptF/LptG family permease, partial [Alloprevotella sp.]
MIKIKRLDSFILGKFLQLFVGAFFICLFVFMMQFTWRWINDLVGKGLTLDILGQFFWYMGITLVPTALPLAILLAALITFGNMGENLELLSMKAAGVPLVRIMAPIFCVVVPLMGVSFYFQNTVSPDAQKGLGTLATSIKISQPAVQIPEGV